MLKGVVLVRAIWYRMVMVRATWCGVDKQNEICCYSWARWTMSRLRLLQAGPQKPLWTCQDQTPPLPINTRA